MFTSLCEPYLVSEYGSDYLGDSPVKLLDQLLHARKEHSDQQVGPPPLCITISDHLFQRSSLLPTTSHLVAPETCCFLSSQRLISFLQEESVEVPWASTYLTSCSHFACSLQCRRHGRLLQILLATLHGLFVVSMASACKTHSLQHLIDRACCECINGFMTEQVD